MILMLLPLQDRDRGGGHEVRAIEAVVPPQPHPHRVVAAFPEGELAQIENLAPVLRMNHRGPLVAIGQETAGVLARAAVLEVRASGPLQHPHEGRQAFRQGEIAVLAFPRGLRPPLERSERAQIERARPSISSMPWSADPARRRPRRPTRQRPYGAGPERPRAQTQPTECDGRSGEQGRAGEDAPRGAAARTAPTSASAGSATAPVMNAS